MYLSGKNRQCVTAAQLEKYKKQLLKGKEIMNVMHIQMNLASKQAGNNKTIKRKMRCWWAVEKQICPEPIECAIAPDMRDHNVQP